MSLFDNIYSEIIFEQLPVSSCLVDYDSLKIVKTNTTACNIYSYTKDEFKKLYIWDVDYSQNEKYMKKRIKTIKEKKSSTFSTKHLTKNKKIIIVTVSVNIIELKGKKLFNFTCVDSSKIIEVESKFNNIEKKFEFFFNNLSDAALIVDKNFKKIEYANDSALKNLGYSKEVIKTIKPNELFYNDKEEKYSILNDYCEKSCLIERRMKKQNNEFFDVSVSIKKINKHSYLLTCRDITMQKKENKELLNLTKLLKENINIKNKELSKKEELLLEQSKFAQMGEMLNMVAHQWRQPLNAIAASAANLSFQNQLDTLDKKTIEDTYLFIQNETKKMSEIINDFMEFNKSTSNSLFNLYDSIHEVIKMILPQLKNRNIKIELRIKKNISIFHNQKSLQHVILNLIMNARDAFESKNEIKNKTIKIYTQTKEKKIYILVEDNAGGINKDIIKKIFNPYFTTKEANKGTGIGLYMSKRMIENVQNSSLSVENIVDGARFKIEMENKNE